MTFDEFQQFVAANSWMRRDQRFGQYCFNTLHDVKPEIANKIRATDADPFYNDSKLPEFWAIVLNLWS